MLIPPQEYTRCDAVELARLVRSGELTPDDLAETAGALLQAHADLNAVAATLPDAGTVPPPVAAGAPDATAFDGVFAGVPFAVKELLAWPGLPWTMGSRLLADNPAPGPSPYAQRLAAAGLRVLCSATSSEFGILGSTETALHGVTHNPWGPQLSAGGSSGGSAALVAAGVLPMAHGSDAGGSLRLPASLTGIVGFKPSAWRCYPTGPQAPGLGALVTDHVMTRTVRDSASLLAATERTGAGAVHAPVGLIEGPDGVRLRVALVTTTLTGREPQGPVRRELDAAAGLIAGLGHDVTAVAAPPVDGEAFSRGFFATAGLTLAQLAQGLTAMLGRPPQPGDLEPFTLELIAWANTLGPDAAAQAEQAIGEAAAAYLTLFQRCDVVLTPTLPVLPWPIGYLAPDAGRETLIRRTEECVGYTPVHNPAGCPAISLPLGRHEGLPVGIHLAAAPGADATVLRLAYELEAAAPWADRRPGTR
jgi:amidase